MINHRKIFVAIILILGSAQAWSPSASSAGKVLDPLEMGPYPAGVTTTVLVDPSRIDPATGEVLAMVSRPAFDPTRPRRAKRRAS